MPQRRSPILWITRQADGMSEILMLSLEKQATQLDFREASSALEMWPAVLRDRLAAG